MRKQPKTVSIIIPVYNEGKTIATIVDRVIKADTLKLEKEIIVVDDGSTDQTPKILKSLKKKYSKLGSNFRILIKPKNEGKGASLRRGFAMSRGEIIVVQDADLEYNPADFAELLKPIVNKRAQVVYGSRMLKKGKMHHGGIFFFAGGQLINKLTNWLYQIKLTDEATGYKVFRSEILEMIELKCQRFEFCPEFTAKVSMLGIPIEEVPISYLGRTTREGKKIQWLDGAEAIWTLLKLRVRWI